MVLASCGVIGSDEQTQAQLIEQSGFTPTEDQTTQPTAAVDQTTPAVDSTVGVLRVAVPTEGAEEAVADSTETAPAESGESGSTTTPPGSTSSTTIASVSTSVATTSVATTTPPTDEPTTTAAPTTAQPTTAAPTTASPTTAAPTTAAPTTRPPTAGLTYKGILAAGDNEINAFDNGRKTVKGLFTSAGVQGGNLIELSRQSSEQVNGVRATSVAGIEQAMSDLNVGDGDACVLFLTSHGNKQTWFVRGSSGLTPDKLDQILDASCGNRPTVALISACYSGIFIGPLAHPNRVVLTAASATNTSFGCSPEATYTYWDGCLIDHFNQASTWEDLYRRVTGCIEGKESAAGVTPSRPQAHFGADVANLSILNR